MVSAGKKKRNVCFDFFYNQFFNRSRNPQNIGHISSLLYNYQS